MAYSSFTLSAVKRDFSITTVETESLFAQSATVQPSELLTLSLREYLSLATAINTEKARSELIIMPVLAEVRRIQDNYFISDVAKILGIFQSMLRMEIVGSC
jgi:hypothetical protein